MPLLFLYEYFCLLQSSLLSLYSATRRSHRQVFLRDRLNLYKNNRELKFNNYALAQNKQYATYGIVGVRKEILLKVKKQYIR